MVRSPAAKPARARGVTWQVEPRYLQRSACLPSSRAAAGDHWAEQTPQPVSTARGRGVHNEGLSRPRRAEIAEEQRRQAIPRLELSHHTHRKSPLAGTTARGEAIDLLEDSEHLAAHQRGKDQMAHQLLERARCDRAAAEHRPNCEAASPEAAGGDTDSPTSPNLPTEDFEAIALVTVVRLLAHLEPAERSATTTFDTLAATCAAEVPSATKLSTYSRCQPAAREQGQRLSQRRPSRKHKSRSTILS